MLTVDWLTPNSGKKAFFTKKTFFAISTIFGYRNDRQNPSLGVAKFFFLLFADFLETCSRPRGTQIEKLMSNS